MATVTYTKPTPADLIGRDLCAFEGLDAQRDHARELNRIRREGEIAKARKLHQETTRVFRRNVSAN